MKLLSNIIFSLLILSSCTIPLNLAEMPRHTAPVATRPVAGDKREAIWARIMRMFAEHDIPIKIVDKGSGFIESDIVSFINAYAIDGQLIEDSNSVYVIAQREIYCHVLMQPAYITAQLKIFVLTDGQPEVKVSIENLRNFYLVAQHYYRSSAVTCKEVPRKVYSTGIAEECIADYIVLKTDSVKINLQKGILMNPLENRTQVTKAAGRRNEGIFFGTFYGGLAVLVAIAAALHH